MINFWVSLSVLNQLQDFFPTKKWDIYFQDLNTFFFFLFKTAQKQNSSILKGGGLSTFKVFLQLAVVLTFVSYRDKGKLILINLAHCLSISYKRNRLLSIWNAYFTIKKKFPWLSSEHEFGATLWAIVRLLCIPLKENLPLGN